jgi:hypothetical protein
VKAKICLMQPFFWQIKKLNIIHKTLLTYLWCFLMKTNVILNQQLKWKCGRIQGKKKFCFVTIWRYLNLVITGFIQIVRWIINSTMDMHVEHVQAHLTTPTMKDMQQLKPM